MFCVWMFAAGCISTHRDSPLSHSFLCLTCLMYQVEASRLLDHLRGPLGDTQQNSTKGGQPASKARSAGCSNCGHGERRLLLCFFPYARDMSVFMRWCSDRGLNGTSLTGGTYQKAYYERVVVVSHARLPDFAMCAGMEQVPGVMLGSHVLPINSNMHTAAKSSNGNLEILILVDSALHTVGGHSACTHSQVEAWLEQHVSTPQVHDTLSTDGRQMSSTPHLCTSTHDSFYRSTFS